MSEQGTLVITRSPGQVVWIGETRVEVKAYGRVQLRITADKTVKIVRDELKSRKD